MTSGLIAVLIAGGCSSTDKDGDAGSETVAVTSGGTSTGEGGTTGVVTPTSAGTSTGGDTGSSVTGGETTGPPGLSFSVVYEQVIVPNSCGSMYCHGGGAGALDLTTEEKAYANLVGVTAKSAKCGQTLRVSPGSLDESILWYRVRPAALDDGMACAPKMPDGSMGLSEEHAQIVNEWIAGGAHE